MRYDRFRSFVLGLTVALSAVARSEAACLYADPQSADARACFDASQARDITAYPSSDSPFRACSSAADRKRPCPRAATPQDDSAQAYIFLGASYYRQGINRTSTRPYRDPDGFAKTGIVYALRAFHAVERPSELDDERLAPLRYLLSIVLRAG